MAPELGARLPEVCSGAPELFWAALRVVGEHCLDEKASLRVRVMAGEQEQLLVEVAPALAEARDVQGAHCSDVTVWAPESARVVSELVPAESVQVWPCLGQVGPAPESFPVSVYCGCSFRWGARLLPHRVVRDSPKLASSGSCSLPVDAVSARLSSERAAGAPWLFLPLLDGP